MLWSRSHHSIDIGTNTSEAPEGAPLDQSIVFGQSCSACAIRRAGRAHHLRNLPALR